MRTRLQRIQRKRIISVVLIGVLLVVAYRVWQTRTVDPVALGRIGPNLVANNDFALDQDNDGLPDGWTTAFADHKGIERGEFTVLPNGGFSMFVAGSNNWLKSPLIAVRAGEKYTVTFHALADDQAKQSPTEVEVWFHWRDERGTDFRVEYSASQTVPFGTWAEISASKSAPPTATQLAVSIHPRSDDRIVVDQFRLGQAGVYIGAWPDSKRAAVALSFDYETAMGGLVHSVSVGDPNADLDPLERAMRMRSGADELLKLFGTEHIRGTFYSTGYNFLTGNRERRQFMGNPTYAWANPTNRWPTEYWTRNPWFSPDPFSDEQGAPGWYFGSQVARLAAAQQDIQSHTFAHFSGSYVTPADWQADFAAWNEVAGAMQIAPATSLAFPWSSSAGMSATSWQVLADAGIRSVTRTNWNQARFVIADRTSYALRPLPSQPRIMIIADEYLQPERLPAIQARLAAAMLQGGAIDIWAHTEEATTNAQLAAWQAVIDQAQTDCWIAPVPEIVGYHTALQQVEVRVKQEQPQYVFRLTNPTATSLRGLTLTLPFSPQRITIGSAATTPTADQLRLDLAAGQTVEINLWPA